MDQDRIRRQATALMHAHGVGHLEFGFTKAVRALGQTGFIGETPRYIKLSAHWCKVLDDNDIHDVMIHEIAHAHAGFSAGHGVVFKNKARALGGSSSRCFTPTPEHKAAMQALVPAPWVGTCPKGHTSMQHRAPQRVKACGKCSPSWKWANVYKWTHKGIPATPAMIGPKYHLEFTRMAGRYGNAMEQADFGPGRFLASFNF
jgi:hypothetical protein